MRVITETEMRAAAGGVRPLTRPDPVPIYEPPDCHIWLIRIYLREPEIGGGSPAWA